MPRRTSLTNSQRRAIIDHQKKHSGISQKALIQWAEEAFDLTVSQTTISRLLADSKRISQRGLVDGCKRNRAVKYPLVEKALKEWFEIYQGRIPITGDIIKTKAACFMTALYPDQEPSKEIASGWSNGWIAGFKTRHNIKEYKTHGERGSADFSSIERLRPDIRDMLSNYAPADVYNMDETGLFYRAQQDRSLATQLLMGRKSDKERLSIVICTNENGTDKLPLWVIGSAKQPRDHRRNHGGNIEQYGIKWRANKKSWMTTILFQEWLLWFEERMRNNNRSVLLLLDNCSAHKTGELELRHTKVYFLPPNTTSVIQPCDAGIIRTFKAYYRRNLNLRLLQHAESSSTNLKILTSDAVLFSISAWDSVLASTISNCFGHCRIRYSPLGNNPSTSNLELEVITNAVNQLVTDLRYKEPILLEEMLEYPGEESKYSPDDNDIVEMIREESPEPDTDVPLTPSASEASAAIDTYIQYIESKKPYSKKWSDLSHLNEMRKSTQQDEQAGQDGQLTADQVD